MLGGGVLNVPKGKHFLGDVIELSTLQIASIVKHKLQFCLLYSSVKIAKMSSREEIKATEDWTGVTRILGLGRNNQDQVLQA